jgi:CubicO group peptidase (beta-lactamase class C family)
VRTTRSAVPLLLAAAVAACLDDPPLKIPYNDAPAELGDGFPRSSPAAEGLDPAALRAAYARFFSEDELVPAIALLVVRHGRLVAEGYCRDLADRTRKNAIMSATKSVTSLLAGIAIDDGLLAPGDPISVLLPGATADVAKGSITFRDLLTMQSGIDFPDDDFSMTMAHGGYGDGVVHVLSRPLVRAPGTAPVYQDADAFLAGAAIARVYARDLEAVARERLLGPLGISGDVWLHAPDGRAYGAYGLYLSARDLARLGELALRRGAWQGERLVSAGWMDAATSAQAAPGLAMPPGFAYGYFWWVDGGRGAFFALGHGGNYVWVLPAKDLVVVLTAEPDTNGDKAAIQGPEFQALADQIAAAAD